MSQNVSALTIENMFADIIIKGNAIYTGGRVFSDESSDLFEGEIAIGKNKIIAIGKHEDIEYLIGPNTEVLEYVDKLIMPGFVDAHSHFWQGAVTGSRFFIDLSDAKSEQECVMRIEEYAKANPNCRRVRGFGWNSLNWSDATPPSRDSLDKVLPAIPVYMLCVDGHTCWMNTVALDESGYTYKSEGLIYDSGVSVITPAWDKAYDFEPEETSEIVQALLKRLAPLGITTFGDLSADDYREVIHKRYEFLRELERKGSLTCRLCVYTKLDGYTDYNTALDWQKEFSGKMFRIIGLKSYLDGVTTVYTGMLVDPYEDRPNTCGLGVPFVNYYDLVQSIKSGNDVGLPVRLHCVGDGAVRMAIDAYEEVDSPVRNTIEHIETIYPEDIARMSKMNIVASMQPEHLPDDNNDKLTKLGKKRSRYEWAFKTILDNEITLAFGTDYPFFDCNPFPGIYSAIERRNYDGSIAGIDNDEKLTMHQALEAYTYGAAMAYGLENEIGSIEVGKLADIIVLDRNLFEIKTETIKDTTVELTIVDGKIVYDKFAQPSIPSYNKVGGF